MEKSWIFITSLQNGMHKHDTEWTDYPTCPHCGAIDQDWWDGLPPKNDGDSWDENCGDCEKNIL